MLSRYAEEIESPPLGVRGVGLGRGGDGAVVARTLYGGYHYSVLRYDADILDLSHVSE